MAEYRHILAPTDFSTFSENAAARAAALAGSLGAKLTLVHVVDYAPPGYLSPVMPAELTSPDTLVARASAELEQWAARLGLSAAGREIAAGSPKVEIARIARAVEADLIVIGSSGQGGLSRLLGSTTSAVLHEAPCDILSVQSAVAAAAE